MFFNIVKSSCKTQILSLNLTYLGILFFSSFNFACSKQIYNTITCEDIPSEQITEPVNFKETVAQIACLVDSPFENEKLNQAYASFFQTPFLMYQVKGVKGASDMTISTTLTRNNDSTMINYLSFKDNVKEQPLYYIKSFSSFSFPPHFSSNHLKKEEHDNIFHSLYYETRDREPTINEIKIKLNKEVLPEIHNILTSWGETSYKGVSYKVILPHNLLSLYYKTTSNLRIDGSFIEQDQETISESILDLELSTFYDSKLKPHFFNFDDALFDKQNNIDYLQITGIKFLSLLFPPYTEITTIKISSCLLEPPKPTVDKCRIIKRMLKDMICSASNFEDHPCNTTEKVLSGTTSI